MTALLVHNAVVATLDDDDTLHRPGWIQIEDDVVVAVGAGDPPVDARKSDVSIDARGSVAMPGMVNGHTHLFQTFTRGRGDDLPLLEWVERAIFPIASHLDVDSMSAAATLGLVENLRSGTTTVLEHQYIRGDGIDDAVVDAAIATGSRLVLARGWADQVAFDIYLETIDEFTSAIRDLHQRRNGEAGRIAIETGPLVPWACSDEGMMRNAELAAELGCGTHIHAAETSTEVEMSLADNGKRHIDWMADLGILGPNTQLAHTVWVNADEIERIAASGAVVVHCPVSNMYLASGVAPIVEMLQRDVTVALATDGPGSNNSQDMFEVLKTTVLLQKVDRLDAASIRTRDVLRAACRGGAAAIGRADDLGVIEPGRVADITIVDLQTPFAVPVHDTYSALVFNASSRDVHTVIVGGEVVIGDGEFVTIDEQAVRQRAIDECRAVFKRAGLTDSHALVSNH